MARQTNTTKKKVAKKRATKGVTKSIMDLPLNKRSPELEAAQDCCGQVEGNSTKDGYYEGFHNGRRDVMDKLTDDVAWRYSLAQEQADACQRRIDILNREVEVALADRNKAQALATGLKAMLHNGVTRL